MNIYFEWDGHIGYIFTDENGNNINYEDISDSVYIVNKKKCVIRRVFDGNTVDCYEYFFVFKKDLTIINLFEFNKGGKVFLKHVKK